MARVFIDPGHGGPDDGAKYRHHHEDDYNLAVSFYLDYELRLQGMTTELSRDDDIALTLKERVQKAKAFDANAFISIHCDAWHQEIAKGFSTHVFKQPNHLGSFIHAAMSKAMPEHTDRGLKESNFYVLRKTPMTAVLVECEFITNPETANFLKEPANQRRIAKAIALGIFQYLSQK